MLNVNTIPGRMPQKDPRQIIFFANILSLFYGNEVETEVLRKEVGTLETYGGRLIPLINLIFQGPYNLLVLEHKPDGTLVSYFQGDLGLTLPDMIVVPHSAYEAIGKSSGGLTLPTERLIEVFRDYPAEWINGYVTDETLVRIAELTDKKTISSLDGSRIGNNKLKLHEYLLNSSLPVFDTCIAEKRKDVPGCLKNLKQKGYHQAVIKSQIGASGIGMKKIGLVSAVDEVDIPEYLFFEGACLVQGWLDETIEGIKYIGSPSIQMSIQENTINLYDITEQILSKDSVHEGNVTPPPYWEEGKSECDEFFSQAAIAAQWLHKEGYRGSASVDLHVVERSGVREVRICEVNARVTGATYPSILARHFLPADAWLLRNIRLSPALQGKEVLSLLKKENLLYRPGKQEGILPINFNVDTEGAVLKGQFLFLGKTIHDANRLLQKIGNLPGMKGAYDRD